MRLKIYAPLMRIEGLLNGIHKEIYVSLNEQPIATEKYIEFEVDLTQFKIIQIGSIYQLSKRY